VQFPPAPRVHVHGARLAGLGVGDEQRIRSPSHVLPIEPYCFADAEPLKREQGRDRADMRRIGDNQALGVGGGEIGDRPRLYLGDPLDLWRDELAGLGGVIDRSRQNRAEALDGGGFESGAALLDELAERGVGAGDGAVADYAVDLIEPP
jgi:hypothetical protein